MSEPTLFDMPSLADYCDKWWSEMDAAGMPPVPRFRAEFMAAKVPMELLGAVTMRAMLDESRRRLRREGRQAEGGAAGQGRYLKPEQMELFELRAWLLVNYDRRLADERAEVAFVTEWCETHAEAGLTPQAIYAQVGREFPGNGTS